MYADGDVKVQVNSGCWIFNPFAVTQVSSTHTIEDGQEGMVQRPFSSASIENYVIYLSFPTSQLDSVLIT